MKASRQMLRLLCVTTALLANSPASDVSGAELSRDEIQLVREVDACYSYKLGGRAIEHKANFEALKALAGSRNAETALAGKLLLRRRYLEATLTGEAEGFERSLGRLGISIQTVLGEEIVRGVREFVLSREPDQADAVGEMLGKLRPGVESAVKSQAQQLRIGTQGLLLDLAIREQLRKRLAVPGKSPADTVGVQFDCRVDQSKSAQVVTMTHQSDRPLRQARIFLECRYHASASSEKAASDLLGGVLLFAIGGDPEDVGSLMQTYAARDQAALQFQGTDRGLFAFVESWEAGQRLELPIDSLRGFLLHAETVHVSVSTGEGLQSSQEFAIDAVKKKTASILKAEQERQAKVLEADRRKRAAAAQRQMNARMRQSRARGRR